MKKQTVWHKKFSGAILRKNTKVSSKDFLKKQQKALDITISTIQKRIPVWQSMTKPFSPI